MLAVFSSQRGIFHPYYVSALTPAVAGLAGAGVVTLVDWSRPPRRSWAGVVVIDVAIAASATVAVVLFARTPGFAPALRTLIPIAAVVAIGAEAWPGGSVASARSDSRRWRRPSSSLPAPRRIASRTWAGRSAATTCEAEPAERGVELGSGRGRRRLCRRAWRSLCRHAWRRLSGARPWGFGAPSIARAPAAHGGQLSSTVIAYLEANQGSAKYLLAASGSQTTAPIIIATGKAVVTIGGFNSYRTRRPRSRSWRSWWQKGS